VPAIPSCIQEPLWDQFTALLPTRQVHHPLGCHRQRVPDRIVFDKLIQVLVFGCGYRRIADTTCSATTLPRRRDEWIALGVADQLHRLALAAYDRMHGLDLEHLAVDGCITKAPCGGQVAGPSPVDRRKRGLKRSVATEAGGVPLAALPAPANRRDDGLLAATLEAAATSPPPWSVRCLGNSPCTWMPAMTTSPAGRCWPNAGWSARSPPGASRHRSRPAAAG
jgi:transposase